MSDLRERIAEIVYSAAISARRGRVSHAAREAADRIMALLDTADSERLDWLEAVSLDGGRNVGVWAAWEDGTPTLRAAIDAARQADHDD